MSNISFDPNSLFKERVVDQSDLTTFIDLTVSLPERCITSFGNSKHENIMCGSLTENGNAFTTNYVDIVLQEGGYINNYVKDTFGITSIEIGFNASFHPIVTIKFVDIKGGNLFHGNEKDRSAVFFNSLFHFPYPKFVLTVKGYYGKPVNFNIKVTDFDAEFESATGNYNVTVKFIGDIYGFLTDIPMSFLMLAPYCVKTVGNKRKFTESNEWVEFAKSMEGALGFKCPALIELYKKVKNLPDLTFTEDEKKILKNAFGYSNLSEEHIKLKKLLTTENIQGFNEILIDIQNNINNNNGKYKSPYFANGFEVKSTTDNKYYIIYANDILDGDTLYKYKEFVKRINAISLEDFGDEKITTKFTDIFGKFDVLDAKRALIKANCSDDKINELPKDFYYGAEANDLEIGVYDFLDYMVKNEPKGYAKYNYNKTVYRRIEKSDANTYRISFSDQPYTGIYAPRDKGVIFRKDDEPYKNFDNDKYKCVDGLYNVSGGPYDTVAYFLQGKTTINGLMLFYKEYEKGVVGKKGIITINKEIALSEQETDAKKILGNIVNYIEKRHEKIEEIKRDNEKRQIVVIPKKVNLSTDINEILEHAKTKVKTEEIRLKKQSKEILNIFKTKFGFLPTINNISKIVFMHFLFFNRLLVNTVKMAITEINSDKRNYEKKWNIVTDFDNMLDSNGKGKIPPYPLTSMKGYTFHDENTTEYPTKIFPKLIPKFPDIAEGRFVDIFYKLITAYQIENITDNNDSNTSDSSFTLVLPHDIFLEKNPYIPETTTNDNFTNEKLYICEILAQRLYAHCKDNKLDGQTNYASFIKTEWENFIKPAIQTLNNSLAKTAFSNKDDLRDTIKANIRNLSDDYNYTPTKEVPFICNVKGTMTDTFKSAYVADSGYINQYAYEDTLKVNLYDNDGVKKEFTINIDGRTTVDFLNNVETLDHKYAILGYFLLFSKTANGVTFDNNLFKVNNNGKIEFNWGEKQICYTSYFWLLRCGAYYYFSSNDINMGVPNPFKKDSTDVLDLDLTEEEQSVLIEAFKKWTTETNDIIIGGAPVRSLKQMYQIDNNKISKKISPNFKGTEKDPLLKRIYVYMFPKDVIRQSGCGNIESDYFSVISSGINALPLSEQKAVQGVIKKSTGYVNEVKTAMYYSLKHIVDNYIHEMNDIHNRLREQKNIIFEVNTYDSYMNDIGETSFVDMSITGDIILETLKSSPSMSIMQFLALIAERNNYLCIMAPLRHVDGTKDEWKNVFEPKPVMENKYEISNTILFYKNNEDSFQSENGRFDNDTLENAEFTGIHPFVVSFGDTSNGIFKGISMNMGGSISTEESIANTLILTGGSSQEARKSINLYDIYKERSYKVSIDMMGNPNITPMMFFDLKNIPMYNGIYRIINVSHSITPNDFTTRVTGVKVSKYAKGESGGAGILYNLFSSIADKIDKIGESSGDLKPASSQTQQDEPSPYRTRTNDNARCRDRQNKTDGSYVNHITCGQYNGLVDNIVNFINTKVSGNKGRELLSDFYDQWYNLKYSKNYHLPFTVEDRRTCVEPDCSSFIEAFLWCILGIDTDKKTFNSTPNQTLYCLKNTSQFEKVAEGPFKKDVDEVNAEGTESKFKRHPVKLWETKFKDQNEYTKNGHTIHRGVNDKGETKTDMEFMVSVYGGPQYELLDKLQPGDIVYFSQMSNKKIKNKNNFHGKVYAAHHVEMYAGKMGGKHYYFGMGGDERHSTYKTKCGFFSADEFDTPGKVFMVAFRLK